VTSPRGSHPPFVAAMLSSRSLSDNVPCLGTLHVALTQQGPGCSRAGLMKDLETWPSKRGCHAVTVGLVLLVTHQGLSGLAV
jgi:hypothetical protein